MSSKKNKAFTDGLKGLSQVGDIGVSMIVPIFAMILLGNYIREKFNLGFWVLIFFVILGVASAFRNLYKKAMKDINKTGKWENWV